MLLPVGRLLVRERRPSHSSGRRQSAPNRGQPRGEGPGNRRARQAVAPASRDGNSCPDPTDARDLHLKLTRTPHEPSTTASALPADTSGSQRGRAGAPRIGLRDPGLFCAYRGLGPSGTPLPYASVATTQSLVTLARRLATQVDELARLTHRRVDIVAVSEGTDIVREYLAMHRRVRLKVVVLAIPLPQPDRVFAPALGRPGYGFAAGWEIQAILDIARGEEPTLDIGIDMPVVRSLLAQGPLFRQRSLCPAPGVRVVALLPLSTAIDDPPGPVGGIPAGVVPAFHATFVVTKGIQHDVAEVLASHPLGRHFGLGLGYQLLRYAASAAETPSLPLSAVPVWRRHGGTRWGDAAFGTDGCPRTRPPLVARHAGATLTGRGVHAVEQTAAMTEPTEKPGPETRARETRAPQTRGPER